MDMLPVIPLTAWALMIIGGGGMEKYERVFEIFSLSHSEEVVCVRLFWETVNDGVGRVLKEGPVDVVEVGGILL